jgi:pyridoxamine 5'-phosphate oxidase family protein
MGSSGAMSLPDPQHATDMNGPPAAYAAAMTVTLNEPERQYLQSQPLARLATVDAEGAPQNSPVGAFLDEETGDILIGGGAMGATRKFRNVKANGKVALVVDDLVSRDPWTVRGLEIRGTAVALDDVEPPVPFMSREVIRITPTWIASWGVDSENPERQIRRS